MNPAALRALFDGDLENAAIANTPGGIEAQEARGQCDFVASQTLPRELIGCSMAQLNAMGIEYIEQVDNLFWYVRLPEGWQKQPTDHSMWSHLVDDKGRKRASIFYKAAFYDRRAHLGLNRRYSYAVEPIDGWNSSETSSWYAVVKDCDMPIWTSDHKLAPSPDWNDTDARRVWYDQKDALSKLGEQWLDERYPDWRDPLVYWD